MLIEPTGLLALLTNKTALSDLVPFIDGGTRQYTIYGNCYKTTIQDPPPATSRPFRSMWLLAFLALTLASLCGKYVESAKLPLEPSSSRGTCRIDDGEPFFCTLEYTANGCRLIDDKGQVRMAYTAVQCSERFEPAEDESTSVIRGNEGVFSVVSTDCT